MIESQSPYIVCERPSEHAILIRLARPAKRNALNNAMVIELGRILDEATLDFSVRCVVIAGDDIAFSAGADIAEISAKGAGAVNDPRRVAAWRAIERFRKPLIAAINGIAFGAGNELAMTCDIIIAGRTARFGQPEVKIGGLPGDGGTQRLPRKVGQSFASLMIMTGNPIDAQTALRVGLAAEVCEPADTLPRALELAATIASRAPLAVQEAKACIRVAVGATMENGLAFEREALWRLIESPDSREGGAAFVEKRPPRFTGKW
jgi:enoyl-CoA hydratase/carnithine racemase